MFIQPKLTDLVSPNNNVREDDTIATKTNLQRLGLYDPPEWGITGFPDQRMFDGLERLQRENQLKPDRTMKPGGPTHTTMHAALDGLAAADKPAPINLTASVGQSAPNGKADVGKVRTALAGLDYLPKLERTNPKSEMDQEGQSALGAFQLDYNLTWDRIANPGGETIRTLDKLTRPHRRHGMVRLPDGYPELASSPIARSSAPSNGLDWRPQNPLQAARQTHLRTLGHRIQQGQHLNEPDELLGETVLEGFGDHLKGITAPQAAKWFKLAAHAGNDRESLDVIEAVADPSFPVRRGRIALRGGEEIVFDQDEAQVSQSGDTSDIAFLGVVRELLKQGMRRGGGRRPAPPPVAIPKPSPNSPNVSAEDDETDPAQPAGDSASKEATQPPASNAASKEPTNNDTEDAKSVELEPGLELPVAEQANDTNRKMPGRIYNAIEDEKGKQRLKEVLEHGTITTTKGSDGRLVNIDVDLPTEAAQKLIEDVAAYNGVEVQQLKAGKQMVVGKDGTIWMARPRSKNQQGAEVQVRVPDQDGENATTKSIKMTFKGEKK